LDFRLSSLAVATWLSAAIVITSAGLANPIWANAEVAFISVGKDNDYGHPAPETISLYELTGSQVFRTDLGGDLAVSIQDSQIRVATRR
jgi:beta-lactamase superfamily II metal-dependent hydrolase